MIYPANFEDKIGFSQIRQILNSFCVSEMGKRQVENMHCQSNFEALTVFLAETEEFRQLLFFDDLFSVQDFYNLKDVFAKIHVSGSYVEIEDAAKLRAFIQAVIQSVIYFKIRHEEEHKYPYLWTVCEPVVLEKELLEAISRILDPKGNIKDHASKELARIRREIIRFSAEADRKIRKLMIVAKQDGLVKEDAEMTIRNGRLCIPVLASQKRKLSGFIHDESATGQTVFIEPTEVFDANNQLRDLFNAENREIIKILTALTDQIRPSIPNLLLHHDFLGKIDFIRAKAKLAIETQAVKPLLFDKPLICWTKAVHPLLFLNFKNTEKIVVPLDLQLKEDERILIISGPNAGGKSVCLKTVGLLQFMLQCGLLVSLHESSEMGIFEDFFIDIGDEQSIDNDLSTYSSHLYNLKTMIENLQAKSLFLIDEFGSGTEPTLGAAMAEAVLENMYDSQAFGIITTHFGNLKLFPDRHKQAINGAMLFDTTALKPLFVLKTGKPGSSFTYEIARQIGFPEAIIEHAIQQTGTAQIDYEKKLEEIENEKLEIDKTLKLVHHADDQLAVLIKEYEEKFHLLEKQRKDILQTAKNQAVAIIDSANKTIENTIREIKENKADAAKTKEIRQKAATVKNKLLNDPLPGTPTQLSKPIVFSKNAEKPSAKVAVDNNPWQVGDAVLMLETQTMGEILQLNGRDITIGFNSISLRTTIDKVIKISKKESKMSFKKAARVNGTSISELMNCKIATFKHTLDVRGKRADAALKELDNYLDEALLLGIKQVKILHGKGDGILRHVLRQALQKRKEIKHFEDEALELGGAGITVVEII